jgi:molecular chaperone DnaK
VQIRNDADSLIYQAEKLLREQGDKVPADLKSEVESRVATCRSALEGPDLSEIQKTMQELSASVQRLGAAMYEQPQSTPPGEEGPPPPPDDEEGDVVEGEFTEA